LGGQGRTSASLTFAIVVPEVAAAPDSFMRWLGGPSFME
jgi:hypothetical protein